MRWVLLASAVAFGSSTCNPCTYSYGADDAAVQAYDLYTPGDLGENGGRHFDWRARNLKGAQQSGLATIPTIPHLILSNSAKVDLIDE